MTKQLINKILKNKSNLIDILEYFEKTANNIDPHQKDEYINAITYKNADMENKIISICMLLNPSLYSPDTLTQRFMLSYLIDNVDLSDKAEHYLLFSTGRFEDFIRIQEFQNIIYNFLYKWQDALPSVEMIVSMNQMWKCVYTSLAHYLQEIETTTPDGVSTEDRMNYFVSYISSSLLLVSYLLNGKFQDIPNKKSILQNQESLFDYIVNNDSLHDIDRFLTEDAFDLYVIDNFQVKINWDNGCTFNVIRI